MDYLNLTTKYLPESDHGLNTQKEYLRFWSKTIQDFEGYPELPYNDELGLVQYEYVYSFPEIFTKEIIFKRILEWNTSLSEVRASYIPEMINYLSFPLFE